MTWHSDPRLVTARKAHTCDACLRVIDPGERYERGFGVDGGDTWTWRWCMHCRTLVHARWYEIEDWDGLGITRDHFEGWADNIRHRRWDQFADKIDWTEQRHAAGWAMRWRTRAGTLLPIPTRSPESISV